jgi:hypothetical protein
MVRNLTRLRKECGHGHRFNLEPWLCGMRLSREFVTIAFQIYDVFPTIWVVGSPCGSRNSQVMTLAVNLSEITY